MDFDDLDDLDFDVDAIVEQHKQKQSGPPNIHHAQGLHKAHAGNTTIPVTSRE
eukprot:gene8632-34077_t